MTYYGVLDTNVIVSSVLKRTSVPGKIVDYALSGILIPLLNEEILDEYLEVLTRNQFGFDTRDIEEFLALLKEKGIFLDRTKTIEDFVDIDDVVFYEVVMTARQTTEAFLITGNIKHFPVKSYVVTPRQMLTIIESEAN